MRTEFINFSSFFHIESIIVGCNINWVIRGWVNFCWFVPMLLWLIPYLEYIDIYIFRTLLTIYVIVVVHFLICVHSLPLRMIVCKILRNFGVLAWGSSDVLSQPSSSRLQDSSNSFRLMILTSLILSFIVISCMCLSKYFCLSSRNFCIR